MKSKNLGGATGYHPYTPPARTAEDDRVLLNWLSTRVTDDGRFCHPDHEGERALVEQMLRKAVALGLTVQAGVYLPRPGKDTGKEQVA